MTETPTAEPRWVFGYGSLIWHIDFPVLATRPARLRGWARRFWQGSHDHRGTPDAPGRVVTLVPDGTAVCVGAAHQVEAATFAHLDRREKNGYLQLTVEVETSRPAERIQATTYVAAASNPAFLGPAPLDAIAAHIHRAAGPSGGNAEYLLELDAALRRLGAADAHVACLAVRVRELRGERAASRR